MKRAEQLLKETLEKIQDAKAKDFKSWKPNNFPYDEFFEEHILKPCYEALKNNIVEIRTTKKTMEEIKTLANIKVLLQKGTYYLVKVSA